MKRSASFPNLILDNHRETSPPLYVAVATIAGSF